MPSESGAALDGESLSLDMGRSMQREVVMLVKKYPNLPVTFLLSGKPME